MDWHARFADEHALWQYPGDGPHAAYRLYSKHSDCYLNADIVSSNGSLLKEAGQALFDGAQAYLKASPDWVVTYPPFGLSIGSCLADLWHCKFAHIKSLEQNEFNGEIRPGETVLFCADDLHTGGSFRKVLSALNSLGARLVPPLAVLANFSGACSFDGFEVVALMHRQITLWDPDQCPLCKEGSVALPARDNWPQLIQSNQ